MQNTPANSGIAHPDFSRLGVIRDAVIEPIQTFLLRKAELEWLAISVFSTLLLGLPGRYAVERAATGDIQLGEMSIDMAKILKSVTPTIDLLHRYQREHEALWSLFFIAWWSEFEAALDDIRIVAVKAGQSFLQQHGITVAAGGSDEGLLRKLRQAGNTKSDAQRFALDLASLRLLGFTPLPTTLADELEAANQTRNVLIHRRGLVDAKALSVAPSLRKFGAKIVLTQADALALINTSFQWGNHLLSDLIALDNRGRQAPAT